MKNGFHLKSRLIVVAFVLSLSISTPLFANDDDDRASLTIQFVDGQAMFHVGEVIPIDLAFSASIPDAYEMSTANYDRSGRLNIEQFHVTPARRDLCTTTTRKEPSSAAVCVVHACSALHQRPYEKN